MNRTLASKIVESLSARRLPDAVYEEIKKFDIRDWRETLWWLSGTGLPHYFLARIRELGREDDIPPAILNWLVQNFNANQRRLEVMAEEFDVLTQHFCDAKLKYAALRGFELAPEYCSDLSLRTWYAHEYFVPLEMLPDARRVVETAGYPFRRAGARGELYFAVPAMHTPSTVEETYTATFPRMVVLHRQIWDREGTGIDLNVPEDLFQRLVAHHSYGLSFPTLADDDLLAVTLIDTFARVLSYWCKLSWFLEISNILRLRQSDVRFWEKFYERTTHYNELPQIADFVFLLCSIVFDVDLPECVRSKVSLLKPALAIWLQHYGRDWALSKYPGSKLSLLAQGEFISDRAKWKKIRRRRLFPFLPA